MCRMKIFFYILMIFFVAVLSGCKGAKAIKSVGQEAIKLTQKTPKVVKNNAVDIAEVAVDFASSNKSGKMTNAPTSGKTSSVARAGAAMVGGAAIVNELQTGSLNAKDLSLGALTLGDRAEKITEELGRPASTSTDSDGGKRMTFKDAEVVVKNGKISALVSQSSAFATARGIHEGSPAQEIFDRYGTDYVKTTYDSQTLYEYKITSADGRPCWLRFAVNNSDGKVGYISERLVQSENESRSSSSSNSSSDAEQTFRNYHRAITNHNYREAYEILSYKQREYVGDFDSYVNGFSNTLSSEVSDMRLVSSEEDACTFDYTVTARDRYQGNRVKVATFKGQVTMAKDKGRWYVRNARSNKVDERFE